MPRISSSRPTLRLVDGDPLPESPLLPAHHDRMANRARAVEAENHAAADLPVEDARAVFAAEVGAQLQGGIVALLTLERRQRLMNRAEGLGLRPFDANLIIAIMQDRARGGEFGHDARADDRLRLIRPAGMVMDDRASGGWMRIVAAVALGLGLFLALMLWILA